MTTEDRIKKNSARCGANKLLEFRGAVAVDALDGRGNDVTYLDLRFAGPGTGPVELRMRSPEKSYKARAVQANELGCLMEAFNLDFNDIPPCRGGWEEFVQVVVEMLQPKKLESVYAKLTVNDRGFIVPGEGRCFSKNPDMEYTDADMRFLDQDASPEPAGHNPFKDDDLPF